MRCPVCDTQDKWKNVDHLRLKPSEMHMCESCGFVSYPLKYKTEEEIRAFYRTEYRPGPQVGNLFTGERKLQYHAHFLNPLFEEWQKAGLTKPVIGEIGSAYGMCLNWIKGIFPEADIHGTELTETYRRVAHHEFGINLVEDFDTSKKYDLIISYHVLEHQLDCDRMLAKYASCLKDSGVMYLSCPIWFRDASNSAVGGFDIEYYWHPDHINAWSEEHLEYIIAKAGLEIIHKDDAIYGNTYILKRTSKPVMKKTFDASKYLKIAENIYKCWQLIQENQLKEAIEIHPNCTAAWINFYEYNRSNFHKDRAAFDKFLIDMTEACPNSADALMFAGDILTRYERYEESRKMLELALKKKTGNPSILMGIANTWRMMAKKEKDERKKEDYLRKSINILRLVMTISTEMMPQAITWAYYDEAMLPVKSLLLKDHQSLEQPATH